MSAHRALSGARLAVLPPSSTRQTQELPASSLGIELAMGRCRLHLRGGSVSAAGLTQLLPARQVSRVVLTLAWFLVFDLAVLLLNGYTSYPISADAVAINIAGRQRMLSQRMTKALFDLTSAQDLAANAPALKELREAAALFAATLNAFRGGGEVKGGDERMVRPRPCGKPMRARSPRCWRSSPTSAGSTRRWRRRGRTIPSCSPR